MSMNMDHWRKLENMKRNLSFCRFIHNKSHIECTVIEFGPVRRDAVEQEELWQPPDSLPRKKLSVFGKMT
jgi:hypothetical protein